jgi:hypothetical protein
MDPVELVWTALCTVLLSVSLWQWGIAVGDWRAKQRQAALTPNSDTIAGQNLARWLSYTIFLDCLVLFCWTLAGSLSIFQGVVERYYELPHITFVGLLYIALLSFAARVLLRAYTRAFINKL